MQMSFACLGTIEMDIYENMCKHIWKYNDVTFRYCSSCDSIYFSCRYLGLLLLLLSGPLVAQYLLFAGDVVL